MKRIVAFGPGPKFKGGIANYNTSLARELDKWEDIEVHIVSWIQQYPAIIPRDFIDRKSRSDQLAGTRIKVHYVLDYNRPASWARTVKLIRSLHPEKIIFQWAIAIQGIPLRYVSRRLLKSGLKVVFDLHFVVQKENSSLDRWITKRCICYGSEYIVHSLKTFDELTSLFPSKNFSLCYPGEKPNNAGTPVLKLFHPVYDMFKKDPDFNVAEFKDLLGLREHVFLFFGFIRKYKGLHNAIEAFRILAENRDDVSLLIVGELFWSTLDKRKLTTKIKQSLFSIAKSIFLRSADNEQDYRPLELVKKYKLQDKVVAITEFVPNEEVHKYFQVSDSLLLFYLTATPSGVESMAYNFGLPILATTVGHFPETIKPGFNGYLAVPDDPASMAGVMQKSIEQPVPPEQVFSASREMSWKKYASSILAI